MTGSAVVVALAAAGSFAVSTSLQHRSAAASPHASGSRLLAHLARQPWWVLGMATGAAGFVLHALALHLGTLTLVQPLLVSGLVFALPVRAALDRQLPSRRALFWAGVTSLGLALFLVVANPTAGHSRPDGIVAGLLVAVGVGLAAVASSAGGWVGGGRWIGLLLGFAAGVLFGLVAGVLKMTTVAAAAGLGPMFSGWPLYALIVLGGWGVLLNQLAYQAAPLALSLPVLNIVDPLVAIAFGAYVFGEKPADQPVAVGLELCGLALMGLGVAALARFTPAEPSGAAPWPSGPAR